MRYPNGNANLLDPGRNMNKSFQNGLTGCISPIPITRRQDALLGVCKEGICDRDRLSHFIAWDE